MKKRIIISCIIFGITLVTAGQQKHFLGEKWGGGVVFFISADSLHGLIGETQDQGNYTWHQARKLINRPESHSDAGKSFSDWRLPNKYVLDLLYNSIYIGDFTYEFYWSSEEFDKDKAWGQLISNGVQALRGKNETSRVRAVRDF